MHGMTLCSICYNVFQNVVLELLLGNVLNHVYEVLVLVLAVLDVLDMTYLELIMDGMEVHCGTLEIDRMFQ